MQETLIALIDDNHIDRIISKKLIERVIPNTKTLEFSSAADALLYFKNHAEDEEMLPDIVFLDIRMPHLTGWEYLDRYAELEHIISKRPYHYVYTSSIAPEDLHIDNAYVEGIYTKPFDGDSLLDILGKAMRKE